MLCKDPAGRPRDAAALGAELDDLGRGDAPPGQSPDSRASLTTEEAHETADLMQLCERALLEAYQPHGVNVGVNLGKPAGAGVLEHVHVHVVPRWNGDTNFMTVVGETRVLPEELPQSAARLKPIFQQLSTAR
jgi:ATP adenylyltransferase